MNVSLTPDLERWVQDRVDSGRYTSASEVVREALRILQDREALRAAALADLRTDLDLGLAELDAGLGIAADSALFDQVGKRGRKRREP